MKRALAAHGAMSCSTSTMNTGRTVAGGNGVKADVYRKHGPLFLWFDNVVVLRRVTLTVFPDPLLQTNSVCKCLLDAKSFIWLANRACCQAATLPLSKCQILVQCLWRFQSVFARRWDDCVP